MYLDYAIQTMTTSMQYDMAPGNDALSLAGTQPLYGDAFGYIVRLGQFGIGADERPAPSRSNKKHTSRLGKMVHAIAVNVHRN